MQPWLTNSELGAIRILLPLALEHCALDGFHWANRLARHASVRVVLLHVVTLKIAPLDNRIYDELGQDAWWRMQKLSEYLHPTISRELRVRMGDVAEEIIAEAKGGESQFVVLTSRRSGRAARRVAVWRSQPVRRLHNLGLNLAAETDCSVVILPAKSCLDGDSVWGRSTPRKYQPQSAELRLGDCLKESGGLLSANGA